ncbi:MAG: hypothetical protein IJX86_04905 [Lachnospiraceae bacterium]|nr:hypothetical protein [Lachnospiraceae bacterium]
MVIQASNIAMQAGRSYAYSRSRSVSMQLTKSTTMAATDENLSFLNGLATGSNRDDSNKEENAKVVTDSSKGQQGAMHKDQQGAVHEEQPDTVHKGIMSRYGKNTVWQELNDKMKDTAAEEMTESMTGTDETTGVTNKLVQKQDASSAFKGALEDIRKNCIARLLEIFFGKNDKRYKDWVEKHGAPDSENVANNNLMSQANAVSNMPIYEVNTFKITAMETVHEFEKTDFATKGTVVNADGTTIEFDLSLSMTRAFRQTMESVVEKAELKMLDPLVINLDTNIAELSDQKFTFDIDSDGQEDLISTLESGSGYLAIDHNEDGIINNGKELFGTESGDGFKDLAAYDEDGNGWIDEADDVFHKLKIWCKDENGEDVLYTLKDKNVGAICLQNEKTDFSVNSVVDNAVKGMIRSTGIFLYETGEVGTMQQLDLAR